MGNSNNKAKVNFLKDRRNLIEKDIRWRQERMAKDHLYINKRQIQLQKTINELDNSDSVTHRYV